LEAQLQFRVDELDQKGVPAAGREVVVDRGAEAVPPGELEPLERGLERRRALAARHLHRPLTETHMAPLRQASRSPSLALTLRRAPGACGTRRRNRRPVRPTRPS